MSHTNRLRSAIAIGALGLAGLAPSAGAAPALPHILGCGGAHLLRPTGTVVLSCADANSELSSSRWSTWTATAASGTTDLGLNLCTPDCAASRIRFFPGSHVELLNARRTSKGLLFTKAVVRYRYKGTSHTFTAELNS